MSTLLLRQYIDPGRGDRLVVGAIDLVAKRMVDSGWDVKARYVRSMWQTYKQSILSPELHHHDISRKKGSGRKQTITADELQEKVKQVRFSDRQTFRSLAQKINIPVSTLHRALKVGALQRTASSIKPHLTPENMEKRVEYCHSFVDNNNNFVDMMDRVDIDEKWFYITNKRTKYIVAPGEEPPARTCKHKSHLIKVMCLTAMARPREIGNDGQWWDGKIGTWFFTEDQIAKRTTKNRAAGTIMTKTKKVDRVATVEMLVTHLLPAIELKWPPGSAKNVRIQQDNATPHPKPGTDEKLNAMLVEMATRGWDIQFVTQPPNSPDTNTLDLAFFRAIQSIQYQKPSKDIDELIQNVLAAHDELPLAICIKVWTTAQMVMNEIIRAGGSNNYKLPHAGKEKIVNEFGRSIPHCLPCTALISNSALNGDAIRTAMTKDQGGSFLHWIVAFPSQQQLSYSFCIVVYHTDKSPTLTVTAPGVRVMVVAYLPHLFLLLSRRTIMMN